MILLSIESIVYSCAWRSLNVVWLAFDQARCSEVSLSISAILLGGSLTKSKQRLHEDTLRLAFWKSKVSSSIALQTSPTKGKSRW